MNTGQAMQPVIRPEPVAYTYRSLDSLSITVAQPGSGWHQLIWHDVENTHTEHMPLRATCQTAIEDESGFWQRHSQPGYPAYA